MKRVALLREAVYNRAAGIAEAHHLGALVERLAHGVVDRLAEYLEMQRVVDAYYLRVASAHEQAQVRERRLPHRLVRLPDEIGKYMALEVVHHDYRDVEGEPHSLGERSPDKQRAEKPGTAGECDCRELRRTYRSPRQGLADHRHYVELMRAGCKFGHDSAVSAVHVLARDHVREQVAVAYHRGGSIVAGRFYAKYNVCHNGLDK